jgi:hypothetical protein
MIKLTKINDEYFFQTENILTDTEQKILKFDIDNEIKENYAPEVPLYQTYNYMHKKYNWNFLFCKVQDILNNIPISNIDMKYCWANVSTPESDYSVHTHPTDITVVYYLKNPCSYYGTYIRDNDSEVIICCPENSILIFEPKIQHSIVSPPKEVSEKYFRYSIVMDYCINKI